MKRKTVLVAAVLVGAFLSLIRFSGSSVPSADAADPPATDAKIVVVESRMHDFMEGVFQSTYLRLKQSMAAEPANRQGWKALRSDALVLAEASNLLLIRKPEKDADKWTDLSVSTREAAANFYQAAKKQDFAGSKTTYEAMLTQCNACHKQFDDGKHQLTP